MAGKRTKKVIILELLQKQGKIPLEDASEILYGDRGELAKLKVIRLLAAYRAKDENFAKIRVRCGNIVIVYSSSPSFAEK